MKINTITSRKHGQRTTSGPGGVYRDLRERWRERIKSLPKHAIQDYLEVSQDLYHLRRVGIDHGACWSKMLEASFSNVLLAMGAAECHVGWSATPFFPSTGRVCLRDAAVWRRKHEKPLGMLCTLMLPALSYRQVSSLGLSLQRDMSDVRLASGNITVIAHTSMSYSDAANLGKHGYGRHDAYTDFPMFV